MSAQAEKAWRLFNMPASCLNSLPKCALNAQRPNIVNRKIQPLSFAILFSSVVLTGCVGASVNNALDTAVISQSENQQLLEETPSDTETQIAATTPGAIPIPVRSPLETQAIPTSETALLPDETPSPVETAATEVLNTPVTPPAVESAQVPSTEVTQLASLETSTTTAPATTEATATPVVASPTPLAAQPEKPKTLFELWFGKKKATAPAKKAVEPTSNTVVAAVTPSRPLSSSSTNGLPGVQRNSAIFGINEEEKDDEDDTSVQVASVGSLGRIISPKGLILQTERVQVDCLKPELLQILGVVERRYGKKVMVTSGYRSPKGNRRAGGARNSTHIYCKAADIQVEGISKWDLAKFLRTVPGRGGVGTYCRTESVHIDVGSQRDWHHPCRRSKKKRA